MDILFRNNSTSELDVEFRFSDRITLQGFIESRHEQHFSLDTSQPHITYTVRVNGSDRDTFTASIANNPNILVYDGMQVHG